MKYVLPLFLILLFAVACNKDAPIPPGSTNPPVGQSYAGVYKGLVNEHVAGVDSTGVYKFDTSYAYTITVIDAGGNKITILGATPVDSIEVDDSGHFQFNDYSRNIEGDFEGDSLHLYSSATSGSYEPPLFYNNTQMYFDGEK